jgi:hypothetical protein
LHLSVTPGGKGSDPSSGCVTEYNTLLAMSLFLLIVSFVGGSPFGPQYRIGHEHEIHIFKNRISSSHKTYSIFNTNINQLMSLRLIRVDNSERHLQHTNTVCGSNEFRDIECKERISSSQPHSPIKKFAFITTNNELCRPKP